MNVSFSGKYAIDGLDGVSFQATVDGANIVCHVNTNALQDIDPSNRMNRPISQFEANRYFFQNIAEKLIRGGRVHNGQLYITENDLNA